MNQWNITFENITVFVDGDKYLKADEKVLQLKPCFAWILILFVYKRYGILFGANQMQKYTLFDDWRL